MPSNAFKSFKFNLTDVDFLIDAHAALCPPGKGKKNMGHLTRSAVVMLCASWEHYIEALVRESIGFFTTQLAHPSALPDFVKKDLGKTIKDSKHDLRPLDMAGNGWKQVYLDHANEALKGLNSPKAGNVDIVCKRFLGLDALSSKWTQGAQVLNDFVSVRGEIAHNARHAPYVPLVKLKEYVQQVWQYAVETDNEVSSHLKAASGTTFKPWNKTK
jgi:hypothetical protein